GWIAEIVVLVSAVVDSVAAANRGPAMKHRRRPRHPESRPEILRVRIVVGRPLRAEPAAALYVDHRRAVQNLVHYRIELVPQSDIERQVRRHLELVLPIGLIKRPPAADHS